MNSDAYLDNDVSKPVQTSFKNRQGCHLSERKKGFTHLENTQQQLNILDLLEVTAQWGNVVSRAEHSDVKSQTD